MNPREFPEFVKRLPEAEHPIDGLRVWLLQGETMQIVFMEAEKDLLLPRHSHGEQWGVVVSGGMELTIGGETRPCEAGDSYFIPSGVEHFGRLYKGFRAVDCFADRDRYHPRSARR
jgi:quercetin dioxygenase-like cupin family protein